MPRLLHIFVYMSVIFAGGLTQASYLDTPVGVLLKDADVYGHRSEFELIDTLSKRLFGGDASVTPVRNFMTDTFRLAIKPLSPRDRSDLRWCFNSLGLPTNLSPEELALYEAEPTHKLFTPLSAIDLPRQMGSGSLNRSYDASFVIDVVRELRANGPLTKKNRVDELRASIEAFLGQSIDEIEFKKTTAMM